MSQEVIALESGEDNANQSITVQLGDYYVKLEFHYQQNGQWLMHILPDGDTELNTFTVNDVEYIVTCIMLEPGCDLLSNYNLTDTLGQMFLVGDEPTLDNLGVSNYLVWYSSDSAVSY